MKGFPGDPLRILRPVLVGAGITTGGIVLLLTGNIGLFQPVPDFRQFRI